MNTEKTDHKHWNSFLLSYSQVFFSNSKILGSLLLLVSFMDFWSGFFGVFSVLVSLVFARQLGFEKESTDKGVFTYNSLLTGLGIGLYFQPSFSLLLYTLVISLLVLFLSVGISRYMRNYGLPFLSIPFLLGMWMVDLSAHSFYTIGLSDRGIFLLNELFGIGGFSLIQFYDWLSKFPLLYSLEVYFLSLGAIFFQYQVLAGIIIAIGIIIHSRIAFLLSLLGFYAAWLFYYFMGASLYDLSYSYIGFNFILTAIALGGFFLIPNKYSMGWMLLILPIVVLTTMASMALFSHFGIGIYALPFNIVVLLFLYANKLRTKQNLGLKEVTVQHFSPEQNLYYSLEAEHRFMDLKYFPIRLPVQGEWSISQAHNGEYTHREKWKHAWDFVMLKSNGEQYQDLGERLTDYLCYNKSIVACYDGVVEEIANGIEDNKIGHQNLTNNWGNTIIIKHSEFLYSKYSHLKKNSFEVKKGDWIRKGQLIGKVGNSGRSPFPHLHFQLQKTPFIGSETINYPFSSYLTNKPESGNKLHIYDYPKLEDKLKITDSNDLLSSALKWDVGREMIFEIKSKGITKNYSWTIESDLYKNTYIHCKESHSFAYFYNDGALIYFKNFIGDKSSALYHFFLAFYKIHHSFYVNTVLNDEIALHLSRDHYKNGFLQDFIAPFYIYRRIKYKMKYLSIDDELSPQLIKLKSSIKHYKFDKLTHTDTYHIQIHTKGYIEFNNIEKDFYAIQKN